LASIAQQAAVALEHGRAVMRGVLAQEIHHRVKNNLQTVASLLRLQARAGGSIDPRKALEDSVNRILAIAAVHELLTERRDDDVDLADLLGRLRATLVQGVADGRAVDEALQPVLLAGHRATALALVFSELLGNALEHGGSHVHVDLRRDNGDVVLAISDDGRGVDEGAAEARDGEEAVELARRHEPDLALMDVKMPRLDGIEAARRILEERPIPIVMLTAFDQRELVERAAEAGVYGYLVKPFREQDVVPAIELAKARYEELIAVRADADSLSQALADRKVIERAKGLLMEREKLSEADAFARLRKASQVSGRPLRVIADAVIATFDAA